MSTVVSLPPAPEFEFGRRQNTRPGRGNAGSSSQSSELNLLRPGPSTVASAIVRRVLLPVVKFPGTIGALVD